MYTVTHNTIKAPSPEINEKRSTISSQQITNPLTMWRTRQTACQQWGNNYLGIVPVPGSRYVRARPAISQGTDPNHSHPTRSIFRCFVKNVQSLMLLIFDDIVIFFIGVVVLCWNIECIVWSFIFLDIEPVQFHIWLWKRTFVIVAACITFTVFVCTIKLSLIKNVLLES